MINHCVGLEICWQGPSFFNKAFNIETIDITVLNSPYSIIAKLEKTNEQNFVQNLFFEALSKEPQQGSPPFTIRTKKIISSIENVRLLQISVRLFQTIGGSSIKRRVDFPVHLNISKNLEPALNYQIKIVNENCRLIGIVNEIKHVEQIIHPTLLNESELSELVEENLFNNLEFNHSL